MASGFVVTMASVMKIHTFTSKEAVYSAGDNATKLFVVNKGVVAKKGEILSAGKLLGLEMVHTMLYRPVKYVETAKVPLSVLTCNLFK